jgi:hypothetical protein
MHFYALKLGTRSPAVNNALTLTKKKQVAVLPDLVREEIQQNFLKLKF